MRQRSLLLLALLLAFGACAGGVASGASGPAPSALDCASMPCAEVMPRAVDFRPVADADHWEGLGADGDALGWLALSTAFVDIKAYSGKPLVTLVGLDRDGVITGARVVHHSEPILLVGIPEQALHDFADFYAGKQALQRVVVGRSGDPGDVAVDAISGATVTALAQNITVLETARALGTAVGVFEASRFASGHFVEEETPWTWAQMEERGVLGRLRVSESELGKSDSGTAYVDLFFAVADPPQIGRALMGEHDYAYHVKQLAAGEHLFVVVNRGEGSFKGSAFVRGGIFDRVRLQQGLREITFRDTDYWNLPEVVAADGPEISEGAIFVLRDGRFDPAEPYELVFLGSFYDHRGAFSREFREFKAGHRVPEALYVADEVETGIPWRQAWTNRGVDVVVLGVYLAFVVFVFVARRYSTGNARRLDRLHTASMIFGFVVVGVYLGAQPSVTQIMTAVGGVVHEWRWDLFLSEPLIFVSWVFIAIVSLVWGRGVFCGWVCPYGAMNELAFKVSKRLGFSGYELPESVHLKLRNLRYVVLAVLIGVFLWDSVLAERMAEVEPFKSTFLVPVWTRSPGFIAWWLVLLGLSFVMYRPFCRYLCPMGGGIALFSSFRPLGPKRRAFCSSCKICRRECEPRAFRNDGTIDPRECLSCLECEATYRDDAKCPPLIALQRLSERPDASPRGQRKLAQLQADAADV